MPPETAGTWLFSERSADAEVPAAGVAAETITIITTKIAHPAFLGPFVQTLSRGAASGGGFLFPAHRRGEHFQVTSSPLSVCVSIPTVRNSHRPLCGLRCDHRQNRMF